MSVLLDILMSAIAEMPAGHRFVLGITGSPGAGKSTTAEALVDGVNNSAQSEIAIVVPMDGYHLSNEILMERGLLHLKGIPETFDSEGFVLLLASLKSQGDGNIYAPKFDRSIEASIPDAIVIRPEHRLCVVEGNYLLLQKTPWSFARQYFDLTWFVDVERGVLTKRLQQRHEASGKTPAEAELKVLSTDLPNAEIVNATKVLADKIIRNSDI